MIKKLSYNNLILSYLYFIVAVIFFLIMIAGIYFDTPLIWVMSGLASCYELENKFDLAIKAYREAIIYEPTFGTLSALAEIYIKKEDFHIELL